jgi:glutathione S-transferase
MELTLVIGNKNYSSWSMRPWVLMDQLGLPFTERLLRFDFGEPSSCFTAEALKLSPTARVPVLVEGDGFATWDTLAIAERLHDLFPEAGVWPADARLRARARALCASMHSGFMDLRRHCPMNIEAGLAEVGARLLREEDGLRADLQRLEALWLPELRAHGGPLLFGTRFCAADAFFAPVAMRVTRYGLPLSPDCAAYVQALCALPAVQRWVDAALQENWWVAEDEPYRTQPDQKPS